MKLRNPKFGCVRIAQQISHTFGLDIDKDVVRRVLAQHYRPDGSGSDGPSWLTFIAVQRQPVERRPVSLRINLAAQLLVDGGHGCVYAPHHRLWR